MLIVIPVGPSDATNLHLLTQAITRLGVVETPVLIVSVPSLQAEAEEAAATLGATVALTPDDFADGWPVGPDRMFIWTIRHLAEIGNEQPWLWLEPDACPVKAGWDVELRDAYAEAKKPYFGFTRPTAWRDAEGNLTPVEGDNMLLGVAIYPPDLHKDKELLPLLNDLSLPRPSHPPVPWDIYLRWHMFRRGVHSTQVIYDRWRTCNYTRGEFDEILCEPVAGERGAVGGTIPDEAVLVHGCKDGSLHRLVIGTERLTPEKVIAVLDPSFGKDKTVVSVHRVSDLPKQAPFTKEQRVLEALNKMDQPRLGAVADRSKVDKDTVKKILPTLGYEILNAGWIRKLQTK